MAKTKKPEKPDIAREEWDMALLCPPDQLRRCWAYEFTREYVRQGNSLPRATLVKLPIEFKELLKNPEWLEHKSYLLTIGIRPQLESATFPQPPEGVLEWLTRYCPTNSVRLPLFDYSPEDVTDIVIDWDKGDPELMKSFRNLIQETISDLLDLDLHSKFLLNPPGISKSLLISAVLYFSLLSPST